MMIIIIIVIVIIIIITQYGITYNAIIYNDHVIVYCNI